MKRTLILILALAMCLGLCACGGAPTATLETPAPEPTPEMQEEMVPVQSTPADSPQQSPPAPGPVTEQEEDPLYFRLSYKAVGRGNENEENLISEYFYHYDDANQTGWVTNEIGSTINILTLDEKGHIISFSSNIGSNGEVSYCYEYEYDRYGNESHVSYYKAGLLVQESFYTYNEYRVPLQITTISYAEDGKESSRSELNCPDGVHGTVESYKNGELTGSNPITYVYEGNFLVARGYVDEDGNFTNDRADIFWTRDEYYNIVRLETAPNEDGIFTFQLYSYEPIG